MPISADFPQRLRAAMTAAGYAHVYEFTAALGPPEAHVSRWLNGKRVPSAESVQRLCEALGVCPEDLGAGDARPMTYRPSGRPRPLRRRQTPQDLHPLLPAREAWACRKLERDHRREAAMGWGPIPLWDGTQVSRLEMAERFRRKAERWEHECKTGVPNVYDRERMGF